MKQYEFSPEEKEMMNFNFSELQADIEKTNFAEAASVDDIKAKICSVWSKVRKYVKFAEAIPIVGKFISILSDLLDTICKA